MSRIPLSSLAAGTLFTTGPFQALASEFTDVLVPGIALTCNVYLHDTSTPATVWTDEFGTTPQTMPCTTDTTGAVPGWVDPGDLPLDLSVNLASGPKTFVLGPGGITEAEADSRYLRTTNTTPVTFTAGGRPKFPVPAGEQLIRTDEYGNLLLGLNLLLPSGNPSTLQNVVANAFLQENPRLLIESIRIATIDDPGDVSFVRFGSVGGSPFGGGNGLAQSTANSSLTVYNIANPDALLNFKTGQLVWGDEVNSIVPEGTTITNTNGGPVRSSITLTLSAPVLVSAGATIFSIGRNTDLTGVGAGGTIGQMKSNPAFAPYLGDQTTPGALSISDGSSFGFRMDEVARDVTGHQDLAQGGSVRLALTKVGRGSADATFAWANSGNVLVQGAVARGDTGQSLQVGASAAQNEQHQLTGLISFTAQSTNTTPVLQVTSTAGLASGMALAGTGIPGGTTISSFNPAATPPTVTMSANATADVSAIAVTATPVTFTGDFGLTFFPKPPSNGYATPVSTPATIPAAATAGQVQTAMGLLLGGSAALNCSYGNASTLVTILNPNGEIPAVGATVVGPGGSGANGIQAGTTVAASPAPTATGFSLSQVTNNNSNSTSLTISSWKLGLDAGTYTGGPLPAPITIEYGSYFAGQHFKKLFVDNTNMTAGSVSRSELQPGIPASLGDGAFDGPVSTGALHVTEGANAKQGVATLAAGTVVVANTSVTATSRIQLTIQSLGTVTVPKAVGVTARSVGTSFTITSADATDTSVIAYEIFEPA